ncbi:tRNA (N(6)-L-threonylcarbamoyladenosine(37)-C(2))-methylthiotransferase MtaB [Vulcanibacillus modesticaldus]|uniref:Threonylcarbamoyladenosine tRNA methylthiotransferase MtaB n=1 Tax=Vulcanibacillus modesticaldus TaxID=337097 RepID=A0A1D2YSC1_9BACI|nr:tRNA (N(6)-L-threonylcarbamoyladenosine(37)-C(2))-methylthiotransferase MtaB [Vulcanibacillus modesticaldus]OEF96944.1 tRNA (N(6)-L-threonylcarbamoyladenosine(37)-C(2))-methylthiotransferase MtaB [Vulcanibacillus modesticaldus]
MPTVAFHTLGCKVNHYETEAIWQLFKNHGYRRVDFEKKADIYVINTCTVTNTGDKKSRQIIRRAIKRNPDAVIAVTGCYAQTSTSEVMDIPGVDIIIGNRGKEKLVEYVEEYLRKREPINAVKDIMKVEEFEELDVPEFSDRTRASLKIQEGCNNFCSYCIIPWARGLSRSRKPENVLKQAEQLVASGYKEIVLTGIHTGGYGEDLEDYSLAKLLSDLDVIDGLKRIRISSIEASQINDQVLDVLKKSKKIVNHLHIPLQAGDDEVLKKMKRKYTTDMFRKKITEIREVLPDIAITTDVIVGFPGETEEQFLNGYRFIEEIGFAELHVFPYSKRSGTPAAKMKDQVPENIKHQRVQKLIGLSNRLSFEYANKFIGKVLAVIPERPFKDGSIDNLFMGYSDNYIQLVFEGNKDIIGKICKVRLDKVGLEYSQGTLISVED